MSPAAFCQWLAAMKETKRARSDKDCGDLLGVSANSIVKMKRNGADLRTALACRALFHRLEPWA